MPLKKKIATHAVISFHHKSVRRLTIFTGFMHGQTSEHLNIPQKYTTITSDAKNFSARNQELLVSIRLLTDKYNSAGNLRLSALLINMYTTIAMLSVNIIPDSHSRYRMI